MTTNGNTNGHRPSRPLVPGINVPMVAFFDNNEDLDLASTARHAVRLAKAGMTSLTCQGSNGEAVHLTREERNAITSATRHALDENNFSHVPVVVGCSAQSTRETILLCRDADAAGGDYALILPPSYYKASYSKNNLLDYYTDVASASPIPIVIYNYPGAVSGTDLSSTDITTLAAHPNIHGCKLTCGNTGKLNRIAHAVPTLTPFSAPGSSGFMCMGGSADFTLQTLIAGGSGIITGVGNIIPRLCVRVYDLYVAGKIEEAQKVQAVVSRADWGVISGGVVGTKAAMMGHFGYGGVARRPLVLSGKEEADKWVEMLKEGCEVEKNLGDKF